MNKRRRNARRKQRRDLRLARSVVDAVRPRSALSISWKMLRRTARKIGHSLATALNVIARKTAQEAKTRS